MHTHYRIHGRIVAREAAIRSAARYLLASTLGPTDEDVQAMTETFIEAEDQSGTGYAVRDQLEMDVPGLTLRHENEEGY